MSITTHVLDTARGCPAANIPLTLSRLETAERWTTLAAGGTGPDGRCLTLLPAEMTLPAGLYKLRYETAFYFAAQNVRTLFPYIEVTFEVTEESRFHKQHFHLPLLITPHSFSTYRGS